MPLVHGAFNAGGTNASGDRVHQDHFQNPGFVSSEYFALIHTQIPINQVSQIPKAKEALNKERDKTNRLKVWNVNTVQPRAKLRERARKEKKTIHFGGIMELCHEKHSELSPEMRSYKGRIVFRGDTVKDEQQFYAVFSEQGTSMVCANGFVQI